MNEPYWVGMANDGNLFAVHYSDNELTVRYGPYEFDARTWRGVLEIVEQLISPEGIVGDPDTTGLNRWKRENARSN
jgi:hypothetical protein